MSRTQRLLTIFSQPRSVLIMGGIIVSIKALIDTASYGIVGGLFLGLTTLGLFGWTSMALLITLGQLFLAGWLRSRAAAFLTGSGLSAASKTDRATKPRFHMP